MKAALLLIDLQKDFLARPGLSPSAADITAQTASLLGHLRKLNLPVAHIHTQIQADGSDAMPHWQAHGYRACVAGEPGESSPPELSPLPSEPVFYKRFFSGFDNPELDAWLKHCHINTVILTGIYLHGCIRAAALDAYARGYTVWIADEATGSTESLHSEITREYLQGRAATFLDTATLLARLGKRAEPAAAPTSIRVARINDQWHTATAGVIGHTHTAPADTTHRIATFAAADKDTVHAAAAASTRAQQDWARTDPALRQACLSRWRDILAVEADNLAAAIVEEVGKPITDAREEVQRSLGLIDACIRLACFDDASHPDFSVRHRPVGTIGVITPWNNPLALPIGKIAPALVYGNGVVWKPSPHSTRVAGLLMDTLAAAGLPIGLVNLVLGQADTARQMMRAPLINAITLTGSIVAGATATALCTLHGKPLQAELGGNNAVIVLADANLDSVIASLARAAFSFSGQRCTAIRRFIVEKSVRPVFEAQLKEAVSALKLGDPRDPATDIGPLISRPHRDRIQRSIAQAQAEGARLLCGGIIPPTWEQGCWLKPTILSGAEPQSDIVQQESFGPVAVIQEATNLAHAITLANAVPHGLVAGLVSQSSDAHRVFLESIEAGIIKLGTGPLPVHPNAPFGGWKASRIGPPEHGVWNRAFYTQPQTIYGQPAQP